MESVVCLFEGGVIWEILFFTEDSLFHSQDPLGRGLSCNFTVSFLALLY